MRTVLRKILRLWGALPLPQRLRWWMVYAGVRKYPVGVVAVPINEDGQMLMFKHTYRGRFPWGLPSGWLNPGEKPEEAVVREIREESGLEAVDVRVLTTFNAVDARRVDLVYLCRVLPGEFRASAEVDAMDWFYEDNLPHMMKSQHDMIRQIFSIIGEH